MVEMAKAFYDYRLAREDDNALDVINDFCNIYAKSYEEYMTIYEILTDGLI